MSIISVSFGQFVKQQRNALGWNQLDLAAKVGRERSWVAHLERGDFMPSAEMRLELAKMLMFSPGLEASSPDTEKTAIAELEFATEVPENRMSRRVVRQFSQYCLRQSYGWEECSKISRSAAQRLSAFLVTSVSDEKVRSKLEKLHLGFGEAVIMALALLKGGAQWAKMSLAQVGFPIAITDERHRCLNHLTRPCLVWSQRECSLVLWGELYAYSPQYLPPVLAVMHGTAPQYLLLDGRWLPVDKHGNRLDCDLLPYVQECRESLSQGWRRLILRGASAENVAAWLERCMIAGML